MIIFPLMKEIYKSMQRRCIYIVIYDSPCLTFASDQPIMDKLLIPNMNKIHQIVHVLVRHISMCTDRQTALKKHQFFLFRRFKMCKSIKVSRSVFFSGSQFLLVVTMYKRKLKSIMLSVTMVTWKKCKNLATEKNLWNIYQLGIMWLK